MTIFSLPTSDKGYTRYNGKIYACTIIRVIYTWDNEAKRYDTCAIVTLGNKNEELDYVPVIYPTEEECYKEINVIDIKNYHTRNIDNLIGDPHNDLAWVEGENGAEQIDLEHADYTLFARTYTGGKKKGEFWTWGARLKGHAKAWSERHLYDACHDTEVVEEDGTSHFRKAWASRITLNESQQAKWEALLKAFEDINKEKDLRIFYDIENETFYALNVTDIKWSYGYDADEGHKEIRDICTKADTPIIHNLWSEDSIYAEID